MIGVASENMLRGLVDAVGAALNTSTRQGKFEKDTEGKKAKVQHDQVLARLASPAGSRTADGLQICGREIRDRQRESPEKFPGFLEFEKRKIAPQKQGRGRKIIEIPWVMQGPLTIC